MYYTYILQSVHAPNKLYTGFTFNIKARLHQHNNHYSRYTSRYAPWRIIHLSVFTNEQKAKDFEQYLKSASGKAFRNKRLI